MTYHRLVATTGTSVLSTNNQPRQWLDENASHLIRWDGFNRCGPADDAPGDARHVLDRCARTLPEVKEHKRVSAEYSLVHAMTRQGRLGLNPQVVLVHSDTFDGELAAELVRRYLERDFSAHVELRRVDDLDAEHPARMKRSLGAFMHQVAVALRGGDPRSTAFAPLGGYKVMTSLGYLTGAYLQFATVYLHEANQVVHEIPWVPIRVDETELSGLASLIRRCVGGVALGRLSVADRETLDANAWLFERTGEADDDVVDINAFTHFLRSEPAYRPVIGPRVRVTASVAEALHSEHERAFARKEVEDLLRRLDEPLRHRGVLHHEADFGHHGVRWSLFKGASGREGVFRAVYRWNDEPDTLDLRRLWVGSHDYEKAATRAGTFEGDVDEAEWTDASPWLLAD